MTSTNQAIETSDSLNLTKAKAKVISQKIMKLESYGDEFTIENMNSLRKDLWLDNHMTQLNHPLLIGIIDYSWTLPSDDCLLLFRQLLILANTVINKVAIVEAQYTGY